MHKKVLRAFLLHGIKEIAGYGSEIAGIKNSP